MYKALLKMHTYPDRKLNRNNTFRVGYGKGLGNTERLTRDQILDGLYYCRTQMQKARERATPDRAEMLRNSIADAVAANDRKKVKEVKQIINSEKQEELICDNCNSR